MSHLAARSSVRVIETIYDALKGCAVLASSTPTHFVEQREAPTLGGRSEAFAQVGDKFDGCDARQKHVGSGFGRKEA